MIEKPAQTRVAINTLLARRWSGRAYDIEKEVTHEKLLALMEAARWAPSCYGEQPWRYIICNRHSDKPAWEKALACLVEGNQQWAENAPVLVLVLINELFSHNQENNAWAKYDTGAASMSICVEATAQGLMVHQMGGFIADSIKEKFSVPDNFSPVSVMAIGYQTPEENLPEDMQERELAPRQRANLEEHFFLSAWGNGIS